MLTPNSILQNRYRIVRKLGQGVMGAVYEAIDQRVSCVVSLKETFVGSTKIDFLLRDLAFNTRITLICECKRVNEALGAGV